MELLECEVEVCAMAVETRESLLSRLRGTRDEEAWNQFFDRYGAMLIAFAKGRGLSDADAADAAQETLLAVDAKFTSLKTPFDRSQWKFRTWLRAVALNKIRDVQRRHGRDDALTDVVKERWRDGQGGPAGADAEADQDFEREWQRNRLAQALERVKPEVDPVVFQAFELYALHGMPAEEVARILGVTTNAVYVSKSKMLRRIRQVLATLKDREEY